MNDHDILSRLIEEHGTHGLAQLIGEVCRHNAEKDEEGLRDWWIREAQCFENYAQSEAIACTYHVIRKSDNKYFTGEFDNRPEGGRGPLCSQWKENAASYSDAEAAKTQASNLGDNFMAVAQRENGARVPL